MTPLSRPWDGRGLGEGAGVTESAFVISSGRVGGSKKFNKR